MRITYLRKTIKDRKTKITKDRHGAPSGGVILNDETIKPYLEQLANLEAKLANDKGASPMAAAPSVDGAAAPMAAASSVDGENPEENAEQAESRSLDVPFPDVVGLPDETVQDLLVELDDHTNGISPSIPDQIGCLMLLVNKLTIDGRLKDAEIARLNEALSAREV